MKQLKNSIYIFFLFFIIDVIFVYTHPRGRVNVKKIIYKILFEQVNTLKKLFLMCLIKHNLSRQQLTIWFSYKTIV